jgi:uncharacterized caspase-like protein
MTDKALLVAINTVPGAPLRGCVNDANALRDRLVMRYGFPAENIRLLYDNRATADAIRSRISWLRAGNSEDDRIVFAFSGHGARQTFRSHTVGIAGTHECLVPVDFEWDDAGKSITDIWLAGQFNDSAFLGHKTVILDCCHSGGMDRSFVRRVTRTRRTARALTPPDDVAWRSRSVTAPLAQNASIAAPKGFTLLSACTATQTAADCHEGGRWCGAFSWALGTILDQGGAKAPVSTVRASVNRFLEKHGYQQDPQAVGADIGRPMIGGAR